MLIIITALHKLPQSLLDSLVEFDIVILQRRAVSGWVALTNA